MTYSIARPQLAPSDIDGMLAAARSALDHAAASKGRGIFVSPHEALGALAEEFAEYRDEVHANNPLSQQKELLDIVVAALWEVQSLSYRAAPEEQIVLHGVIRRQEAR